MSGLPGTSVFAELRCEAALAPALEAWRTADRQIWNDAEKALRAELAAGEISAFDQMGTIVPPEFWMANNLRNSRVGQFLLRAADIERLLERKVITHRFGEKLTETLTSTDLGRSSSRASPRDVASAALQKWYLRRRDGWPADRKHPSQDEDLTAARDYFAGHRIRREAIRALRTELAPKEWTKFGRRKKLAQE